MRPFEPCLALVPHHVPGAVGLAFLELRVPLRVADEQEPLALPFDEQDDAGVVGHLARQLGEGERARHHAGLQPAEVGLADVCRKGGDRLQRAVAERRSGRDQALQRFVGVRAEIEAIDVLFRTEHADRRAGQREPELGRRHPGMHVLRRRCRWPFGRVSRSASIAGVVVDAVERDQFREFRAQGEVQAGDVAHRRRRQAVQFERPAGLRVLRIHRGVHPDVLDPDVLEELRIEAGDVVLVLVGHDEQVEALLAAARSRAASSGGSRRLPRGAPMPPTDPQSIRMWKSSTTPPTFLAFGIRQ